MQINTTQNDLIVTIDVEFTRCTSRMKSKNTKTNFVPLQHFSKHVVRVGISQGGCRYCGWSLCLRGA